MHLFLSGNSYYLTPPPRDKHCAPHWNYLNLEHHLLEFRFVLIPSVFLFFLHSGRLKSRDKLATVVQRTDSTSQDMSSCFVFSYFLFAYRSFKLQQWLACLVVWTAQCPLLILILSHRIECSNEFIWWCYLIDKLMALFLEVNIDMHTRFFSFSFLIWIWYLLGHKKC